MKKWILIIVLAIVLTFFLLFSLSWLATPVAHARDHHHYFGIWIGPPAIRYYGVPYDYYRPSYRIWVPAGYWEWQWDSYYGCWRKIWIPGR